MTRRKEENGVIKTHYQPLRHFVFVSRLKEESQKEEGRRNREERKETYRRTKIRKRRGDVCLLVHNFEQRRDVKRRFHHRDEMNSQTKVQHSLFRHLEKTRLSFVVSHSCCHQHDLLTHSTRVSIYVILQQQITT
jgi:hypothetical protein